MGVTDPTVQVDHIDRDPLNCRKANLRVATNALNHQNVVAHRGARSRFRGVTWDKTRNKWQARVKINYKTYMLGRFDSEEEAASVAAAFRAEHMPYAVEH